MTPPPIVTRFAPSPTGHLHVGGARTALFCWAFARSKGGKFMIRIEDTDAARSSDESARGILEDLAWLGIDNDLGPCVTGDGRIVQKDWTPGEPGAPPVPVGTYFQAQRIGRYNARIEQLVKAGRAYPAFDTPEETEAQRQAAVAAKRTYRYPRPADVQFGVFNDALAARWARAQAGERHVIRFVAPREEIVVQDQLLGDVRIAAGELDDFVIRKADHFPTYHFAVVVDDEEMGVTHVLRAQEHLANTPRHVALQHALGFRTPVYAHVPIIMNMDNSKMSKRDKAKAARAKLQERTKAGLSVDAAAARSGVAASDLAAFLAKDNDSVEIAGRIAHAFGVALPEIEVSDFREAGYLPEAICNFLALLGWNPGMKTQDGKDLEKFDNAFLAEHFSLDRVNKGNSKFDRAKLLSFNGDYIAKLSDDEFRRRWSRWLEHDRGAEHEKTARAALLVLREADRGEWLVRAVKQRAKTLRDALGACEQWLSRPDDSTSFDPPAVAKHLTANDNAGLALLAEVRARLAAAEPFDPATIHGILEQLAQQTGAGMGAVAQPIRVAVAGVAVTPPLGETLAVLGKASTLARIDACLGALRT